MLLTRSCLSASPRSRPSGARSRNLRLQPLARSRRRRARRNKFPRLDDQSRRADARRHPLLRSVAAVVSGPAAQAGIQPGDAIVKVDGKPVRDPIQLTRSIGSHPPGATVKLEIVRDGKSREVEVNLGRRPDETDQARRLAPRGRRAE